jgi:hypothetical protein
MLARLELHELGASSEWAASFSAALDSFLLWSQVDVAAGSG